MYPISSLSSWCWADKSRCTFSSFSLFLCFSQHCVTIKKWTSLLSACRNHLSSSLCYAASMISRFLSEKRETEMISDSRRQICGKEKLCFYVHVCGLIARLVNDLSRSLRTSFISLLVADSIESVNDGTPISLHSSTLINWFSKIVQMNIDLSMFTKQLNGICAILWPQVWLNITFKWNAEISIQFAIYSR